MIDYDQKKPYGLVDAEGEAINVSESTILIVDDNSNNLKLSYLLLTKKGYKVRLAQNGKMAINSVESSLPDLILLDVSMPDMDGFEVCKRIKEIPGASDIPVIFLSALKEEIDIVNGFNIGGLDYVTKPFQTEVLLARINTHLTMSRLRKDLLEVNEKLEQRVKERTQEIFKSETRLQYALQASNEGIWDWDIANNKIYFNDTWFTMLGYDPDELPHEISTWQKLINPDDQTIFQNEIDSCLKNNKYHFQIEYRLNKKDGNDCWIQLSAMAVKWNNQDSPIRMVGTHTDISSNKEVEEELRQLASYDTLTKLPNRNYFLDILNLAIKRTKRNPAKHAILFMDLDRFKTINDSLGHSAGDLLLNQVGKRLKLAIRGEDIVARLGGDEFTILLNQITNIHQVTDVANRIIEILSHDFTILDHKVVISPSIGIVLFPEHGNNADELLKKADAAMYKAKREGGNNIRFYDDAMNNDAQRLLELEEALRYGLNHNEIILHYQPKIDLFTGEFTGMEALCRWQRNSSSLISPNEFIPIAEETGLIIPLTNTVLAQASKTARKWIDKKLLKHNIAVNISPRQFRQQDLLDSIIQILEVSNFPLELLQLEITEAAVVDDPDKAILIMDKIKDCGISLALDDFGTGYSSLNYLKKFPIDTLKIDMSFVRDMEQSNENKNIVKSIIELSHNLNIEVVAEGVETKTQAKMLRDMGCNYMQGLLYSMPIPSSEIENLLIDCNTLDLD